MIMLYYVFRNFNRDKERLDCNHLWLKITLLLYLIPLPLLKKGYLKLFAAVNSVSQGTEGGYTGSLLHNYVITVGDRKYFSNGVWLEAAICLVWITVVILIMAVKAVRFTLRKRRLLKHCVPETDAVLLDALRDLKKSFGIRRKVSLYYCENISPFSTGLWNPVIIVPLKMRGGVPDTVLKHELIHIKRYDMLYQMLAGWVLCFHWFNPLVYFLPRELNRMTELVCDSMVTKGHTREEKMAYVRLIVREASVDNVKLSWSQSLSREGSFIEERIVYIMKNRNHKIRGIVSAVCLGMAMMASSLTVFAYEDVTQISFANGEAEESGDFNNIEVAVKLNAEDGGFLQEIDCILYDRQFVDGQGNIYEINPQMSSYLSCKHTYRSGEYQTHAKDGNGGCKVKIYEAKICTICHEVEVGDLIQSVTFSKCTH